MGEFLKNINWKHVLIMCIGNVFAGMGIGIFKLAGLGTDPFSWNEYGGCGYDWYGVW